MAIFDDFVEGRLQIAIVLRILVRLYVVDGARQSCQNALCFKISRNVLHVYFNKRKCPNNEWN